jgi:hypothetical protein
MTVFEIKRGDTAPAFEKSLNDELGQPVNLDGLTELDFHMRDENYETVVDDDTTGNVSVENVVSGDVSYQWQSGDTDTLGSYKAEFVVTYDDGTIQSFPRNGMYDIEVTEDIDD